MKGNLLEAIFKILYIFDIEIKAEIKAEIEVEVEVENSITSVFTLISTSVLNVYLISV